MRANIGTKLMGRVKPSAKWAWFGVLANRFLVSVSACFFVWVVA